MSNQVEIDAAALAAEAASVKVPDAEPAPGVAAAPGAEGAPGAEQAPGELTDEEAMRRAGELAPKLKLIIQQMAKAIMPAWELQDEECEALAGVYALPAVYWFPSLDIPLKWACLINAAITTMLIVDKRRDTKGRLVPFRMKRAGSSSDARPEAPADDEEGDQPAPGRGFSTAA
jgi:hypothetical protein